MTTYIIRRLLGAIPTLILISMLVFVAIDIMPGSYVDFLVAQQIQETGQAEISPGRIKSLEAQYGYGKPLPIRYWKWFSNFVIGDMGRSRAFGNKPVSDLIGERLLLTIVISLCSLAFSMILAVPIGVYSAVKQYSWGDHFFTFVSMIGLSVPNFLLALVFLVIGFFVFEQIPGGLFSPEFSDAQWSLARFLDMLNHLWIPVVILGSAGMAGTMRVMRGNMLDQLSSQCVDTARAKGLSEFVVITKYAMRVALNPLITSLGMSLPSIVSGSVIVSLVLNLPTTGPMLFDAVMRHDEFLAGSFVMFLSGLLVLGNILADIGLAWLDPRIRFE